MIHCSAVSGYCQNAGGKISDRHISTQQLRFPARYVFNPIRLLFDYENDTTSRHVSFVTSLMRSEAVRNVLLVVSCNIFSYARINIEKQTGINR